MGKKIEFLNYSKDTDVNSPEFDKLRTSVSKLIAKYMVSSGDATLDLGIFCGDSNESSKGKSFRTRKEETHSEEDMSRRRALFKAVDPSYPDILVLPSETEKLIEDSINMFQYYDKIFKDWNLGSIIPFPCVALNFHGSAGTGKTLAAQVFSRRIGKKIILGSYAQIASMYVGEGAKNLEAMFGAAEEQDAVLFLDEADSLLSKRIQGETTGVEAGINAMRGQLLICLEKFKGVVILASNLIKNYDKAFETRITSVEIPLPSKENRAKIWANHLPKEFPLDKTVTPEALSEIDGICGRDIRNAVVAVARKMANRGLECASLSLFREAVDYIVASRFDNLGVQGSKDANGATRLTIDKKEGETVGKALADDAGKETPNSGV